MLASIDTLIQNEHQYFTRLAGSRPISFRRQLKIRDRLIEHQSSSQLIEYQSDFSQAFENLWCFHSDGVFHDVGAFPLYILPKFLPAFNELNPFFSKFGEFRTAFSQQQVTILSQLFVLNQIRTHISIYGFEMAV